MRLISILIIEIIYIIMHNSVLIIFWVNKHFSFQKYKSLLLKVMKKIKI